MSAVSWPDEPPRLAPLLRLLRPAAIAAVTLALAWGIVEGLSPWLNPPIARVRVEGALTRLDSAELAAALRLETGARLFEVELDALRSRIEALPWVAQARVSRRWPDQLTLRVRERVAVGRWGETALIDSDHEVFVPAAEQRPDALPALDAPAGHEAETVRAYEALRRALADSLFSPVALTLDTRGEWRLRTRGGVELRLGQGDPQRHVPTLLGAVADALTPAIERVAYVDLRYANGFSVGWADACSARNAVANCAPGRAGTAITEGAARR